MVQNSGKEPGTDAALDNHASNRILLILAGALILVTFMDMQARRHYEALRGPSEEIGDVARERLDRATGALSEPIRERAETILGRIESVDSIEVAPELQQGARAAREHIERLSGESLGRALPRNLESGALPGVNLRPLDAVEFRSDSFYLYFIRYRGGGSELVRVRRSAARGVVSLGRVIELLQQGPELRERGLLNAFDRSITVHSVRVENGVAIVDLDARIGRMGNHVIRDRLDQLTRTLTQFPGVSGVQILVDGEAVETLGAGALPTPAILRPDDRPALDYAG